MSHGDKKALQRKYAGLYEEVEAILFRHDPVGIKSVDNTDEYDPEVSTILPRAVRAASQDEVERILRDELASWFGPDTKLREESLESIAAEIYGAVLDFRRAQCVPNSWADSEVK